MQLVLVAGPQPEAGVAAGQPVGLVDHDALAAVPHDAARTAPVWTVSVALPTVAVVDAALSGAEALTASERRVAVKAAEGRSNRDIAQELFVTPKTVEVHLSAAYRKLGIGSRRELPQVLEGVTA